MVKKYINAIFIFFVIIGLVNSCKTRIKDKDMEQKRREKFLKILTEQARIRDFEKEHIDFMIERFRRIPLYKMKSKGIKNIEEIKEKINSEYKDYEIIYTGRLDSRDIVLIGKPYKYKSCLKWGALYDVTDKKIIRVGEINDKGQFFYVGNELYKNPYPKEKLFYVIMLKKGITLEDILKSQGSTAKEFIRFNPEYKEDLSIKMDVLITDEYDESLVYGIGYLWWYNKKSKKWKWLIFDTWH